MSDALHASQAPVIFSHSSARALANHLRNVPDSILRLVAANHGIVMVNFNPGFVSEAARVWEDSTNARLDALQKAGADSASRADSLKAWQARAPHATLSQVADHVEYIRRIAGIDCVGIGSDFDGITEVPVGMEDVSKFPDLIAELLRRGWTDADVQKLIGLNTLRVMREAERVAREMRGR
jgi:membrane dipeptidase